MSTIVKLQVVCAVCFFPLLACSEGGSRTEPLSANNRPVTTEPPTTSTTEPLPLAFDIGPGPTLAPARAPAASARPATPRNTAAPRPPTTPRPTTPKAWTVVASIGGPGNKQSQGFRLNGGSLRARWQSTGEATFYISRAGTQYVLASCTAACDDMSYPSLPAERYYLKATAGPTTSWGLTIEELR